MNLILTDKKLKTKLPGVLRAALKLFNKKGLDGTTIKDIAREGGVAEGSLYRHYKSKEDLAWDLFSTHLNQYTQDLTDRVFPATSTQERVRLFIKESFEAYESDPDLFTYLILQEHNELQKYPQNQEHPGTLAIRLIKEGQSSGEIRDGDPVLLASLFIGAMIRIGVVKMYGTMTDDLRNLIDPVSIAAWDMLKRPTAGVRPDSGTFEVQGKGAAQ